MKTLLWLCVSVIAVLTLNCLAEDTSTSPSTTSSPVSTTTISPQELCANLSGPTNCDECVKITSCYYCKTSGKCEFYPYKHVFPSSESCDMGDIRWGVCWFNFKAMVISMGVIGGILIISIIICCCCCCRTRRNKKLIQEEAKYEREREERRMKNLQRQKDSQSKHDEIRRKYGILEGLIKDDHPYQRFEA